MLRRARLFQTSRSAAVVIGLALAAVAVIAFFVGRCFGLAVGLSTGSLGVACVAIALAVLLSVRPWRAQPNLEIALDRDGHGVDALTLGRHIPLAPVDADVIVNEELRHVRESIPPPDPPPPQRSMFEVGFTMPEFAETRNEAVKRLRDAWGGYEPELREWLSNWDNARWNEWAYCEVPIRALNSGQAVAEHVEIVLRFPPELTEMSRAPSLRPPPQAPRFHRRGLFERPEIPVPESLRGLFTQGERLGEINGPSYLRDAGSVVARFAKSGLAPGAPDLGAQPLRFVASRSGTFDITWTAYAQNMPTPAKGAFTIRIPEVVRGGEALASLDALVATGDVRLDEDESPP